MKSRFAYGMFAGFALACLFFFFFLFFFPNVFRTLTAKNSPRYPNPVAMTEYPAYNGEYVSYSIPTDPGGAPAQPTGDGPIGYSTEPPYRYEPPAYDGPPSVSEAPYRLDPVIAYYNPNGDLPYDYPGSPYTPAGLS